MNMQRMFVALFLLSTLPGFAQTGITSYRLGDNTGEDWEPAVLADGSYVYAFWPHYLATPYRDSSGAQPACLSKARVSSLPALTCTSSLPVMGARLGAQFPFRVARCKAITWTLSWRWAQITAFTLATWMETHSTRPSRSSTPMITAQHGASR